MLSLLLWRLAVPVGGPDPDSDPDPRVPTLCASFRMFVTLLELPRLPVLDFILGGGCVSSKAQLLRPVIDGPLSPTL